MSNVLIIESSVQRITFGVRFTSILVKAQSLNPEDYNTILISDTNFERSLSTNKNTSKLLSSLMKANDGEKLEIQMYGTTNTINLKIVEQIIEYVKEHTDNFYFTLYGSKLPPQYRLMKESKSMFAKLKKTNKFSFKTLSGFKAANLYKCFRTNFDINAGENKEFLSLLSAPDLYELVYGISIDDLRRDYLKLLSEKEPLGSLASKFKNAKKKNGKNKKTFSGVIENKNTPVVEEEQLNPVEVEQSDSQEVETNVDYVGRGLVDSGVASNFDEEKISNPEESVEESPTLQVTGFITDDNDNPDNEDFPPCDSRQP